LQFRSGEDEMDLNLSDLQIGGAVKAIFAFAACRAFVFMATGGKVAGKFIGDSCQFLL